MTARIKELSELKQMTDAQLNENIVTLKKSLLNLRIKSSVNIETNTHVFKASKKKLARIKTLINQRKAENNNGAQA